MTDETIHKSTRTLTREAIASYLHRVAVAFGRGGAIAVDDAVTVDPPAETDMEIDVEHDGDAHSYELEFVWPASHGTVATDAAGGVWEGVDADADSVGGSEDEADSAGAVDAESGTEDVDPGVAADDRLDTGAAVIEAESTATETAPPTPSTQDAESGAGRRGTFELYEDAAGEWRWRLRHANGNVIADGGEGYTTKANAKNGIESVKRNAPAAVVEEQD